MRWFLFALSLGFVMGDKTHERMLTESEEELVDGQDAIDWDLVDYSHPASFLDATTLFNELPKILSYWKPPTRFVKPQNDYLHKAMLLHIAAARGHSKVVQRLLKAGADPNAECESEGRVSYKQLTPLIMAVVFNRSKVVDQLLGVKRIDVNRHTALKQDSPGPNAAAVAANNGFSYIFSRLVRRGAKLTSQHLIYAAMNGTAEAIKIMELCVRKGVNVNESFGKRNDMDQDTAMHVVSQRGWFEVARWLIDHGADVNAKSGDGLRPLDLAMNIDLDLYPWVTEPVLGAEPPHHTVQGQLILLLINHGAIAEGFAKEVNGVKVQESIVTPLYGSTHPQPPHKEL